MHKLFHNVRFYVLLATVFISLLVYLFFVITIPDSVTRLIKTQETYGLLALTYLYFSLLVTPLTRIFLKFPGRAQYVVSRRALGVSVFYFALLHALIGFFGELGGFSGLGFLSSKYLLAIGFSATALLILTLQSATSFDFMVAKLTYKRWKFLHRFVYLAGILILIHAMLLGSHYSDLSGIIPQITFGALAILFLLESMRIDALLQRKWSSLPKFGVTFGCILVLISGLVVFFLTLTNPTSQVSFDIHAAHRQLALQAQESSAGFNSNIDLSKIPGLNGDKNKRYTVSFFPPDNVQPNQDVTIRFRTYDASSGSVVSLYRIIYAKPMHMIVTDSSLTYFSHIHPTQTGTDFIITTQFPKSDVYHIYLEFQPFGGIEQQVAFTLPVGMGTSETPAQAAEPVDSTLSKTFGNYEVALNTNGALQADQMSLGYDKLTFTVRDAKTKKPITTLQPYLASFGHLTMINEKTYDFLHVHPYSLVVPAANATSGPTVDFLPIGIYGPFKPGIYRVFAEFNPDGNLITTDFTVKVN